AAIEYFDNVVRRRLAFVREVSRDDYFIYLPVGKAPLHDIEPDLTGPDDIERRKAPHDHEIKAVIRQGLLHHEQVPRRFDHAKLRGIAPRRPAQGAQLELREAVALGAAADALQRPVQRLREPRRPRLAVLQQMSG